MARGPEASTRGQPLPDEWLGIGWLGRAQVEKYPAMHKLELTLTAAPTAPGAARDAVRTWLVDRCDQETIDTASLLVTELVTNAVLHGRDPGHRCRSTTSPEESSGSRSATAAATCLGARTTYPARRRRVDEGCSWSRRSPLPGVGNLCDPGNASGLRSNARSTTAGRPVRGCCGRPEQSARAGCAVCRVLAAAQPATA